MNPWLIAATAMLFGFVPCGIAVFRGNTMERLVALQMANVLEGLLLLMLAEGFNNPNFYDLALAISLLAFGGGLVFVRFLERWL